jgi:hypothetical protein
MQNPRKNNISSFISIKRSQFAISEYATPCQNVQIERNLAVLSGDICAPLRTVAWSG